MENARSRNGLAGLIGASSCPISSPSSSPLITVRTRSTRCCARLPARATPSFEVLVADDGSRPDTAAVVDGWKGRIGRRLVHVWHPDEGFRLAEIRNRAILAAAGEYCIFLDGDCLVRSNFIVAHRALAERGWFVTGNRVLLSSELTQRILREQLTAEQWNISRWLARVRLAAKSIVSRRCFRCRLGRCANCTRGYGAARAVPTSAFGAQTSIAVDGFDSGFAGWGREDSDLFVRLIRAGVRRKDGRWGTGVLHLWHPEADRGLLPENERRLDEVLSGDRVQPAKGLSALRAEIKAPTTVH